MTLQVSQVAVINAQLGVGGITESVSVSAEAPLLETSNANRGTVIDQHRISELPLQSRSPMALAVLVAGVNYNAQAIYLRPFDNGALADWSMNGGQNRNNEFLLDGAPNNANQDGNNIAYVPPADSVQEFKISTNSYDAQYGRYGRRCHQRLPQVGHEQFSRERRRRLHAPQVARRQLVPAQFPSARSGGDQARKSTTTSISTVSASMVPSGFPSCTTAGTRPSFCSRARSIAKARRRRSSATVPTAGHEERRLQRARGCAGSPDSSFTIRRQDVTSTASGPAIRSRGTGFRPSASTRSRRISSSTTRTRTT